MTGRRKRPHPDAKPTKPERLNLALTDFLKTKGLRDRVIQANAIDDWPNVVGPQISKVTEALRITPDGTLFVAVTTKPRKLLLVRHHLCLVYIGELNIDR